MNPSAITTCLNNSNLNINNPSFEIERSNHTSNNSQIISKETLKEIIDKATGFSIARSSTPPSANKLQQRQQQQKNDIKSGRQ